MSKNDYIEIGVEVIHETIDAVLFHDGDNELWVPKSCMNDWPNVRESGTAEIVEWFALREGLI